MGRRDGEGGGVEGNAERGWNTGKWGEGRGRKMGRRDGEGGGVEGNAERGGEGGIQGNGERDRGGGRERREGGYKEMEKGDGEDKDGQTGVCYINGCSHMESCETM